METRLNRKKNKPLAVIDTTPSRPPGHDNLQYQIIDMIDRYMMELVYSKYLIVHFFLRYGGITGPLFSQWVF